jgi:hypothetical protein
MEQSEDTVMEKSSPPNEETSSSGPKIEAMSFESKDTVSKDQPPSTQPKRSRMTRSEYNIW